MILQLRKILLRALAWLSKSEIRQFSVLFVRFGATSYFYKESNDPESNYGKDNKKDRDPTNWRYYGLLQAKWHNNLFFHLKTNDYRAQGIFCCETTKVVLNFLFASIYSTIY